MNLSEKGLEAAAKATFAKANESNLKPETIESLWPSQHMPHWSGLAAAAITAYLQAAGSEEDEAARIRKSMEDILRKQSERDIPFAPQEPRHD